MEFTERFAYRLNYSDATFCDQATIDFLELFLPVGNIVCREGCANINETIGTTDEYCSAFSLQDNWSYGYKSWVNRYFEKFNFFAIMKN